MEVKPVPGAGPQWPLQVVQAMQNQLLLLFSDNAMAAHHRPRSGSSQLSHECTASHPGKCIDLNESYAEASDKSWASEADSSSILCRDHASDAEVAGCTSTADLKAPWLAAGQASDGVGHRVPQEARIGAAAPQPPDATDQTSGEDESRCDRLLKRKGSPVTVHDVWAELLATKTFWSRRLNDSGIVPRASGPQIELQSQPLPSGWEQFLDLKTGRVYYMNWETCERTCQDPRRRERRGDALCSAASDYDEDSSSETVVLSSSDYSYEDTLGSAQREEACVMSS